MKNLGYKTIFGTEYTHDEVFRKNIIDGISQILMNIHGIGEKSFKALDVLSEQLNLFVTPEIISECDKLYRNDCRMEYICENLYHTNKEALNAIGKSAIDIYDVVESIKTYKSFKQINS